MKKSFLILAVLLTMGFTQLFAQTAKVTYVKGKVEVSSGSQWVPLKVGDSVSVSQTISTGFQSEAKLSINGSIVAVAAFTRVKIETLKNGDKKDSVGLYVNTGAVRSQVNRTENKKIDYTARTPVAVASVRGTDFTIYASGRVKVKKGAIAFYAASKFNPLRNSGKRDSVNPNDEKEANANTPADKIDEKAPKGSIVIGAGQNSKINEKGKPDRVFNRTKRNSKKVFNTVKTAKEKDILNSNDDIRKQETNRIDCDLVIEINM